MEVYSEKNIENNTLIHILDLEKGVYFVELKNEATSFSQKLILK